MISLFSTKAFSLPSQPLFSPFRLAIKLHPVSSCLGIQWLSFPGYSSGSFAKIYELPQITIEALQKVNERRKALWDQKQPRVILRGPVNESDRPINRPIWHLGLFSIVHVDQNKINNFRDQSLPSVQVICQLIIFSTKLCSSGVLELRITESCPKI